MRPIKHSSLTLVGHQEWLREQTRLYPKHKTRRLPVWVDVTCFALYEALIVMILAALILTTH